MLWRAVVARDKASDGQFYYSVATTGVYCRPSCPSRLARRGNVRFHASAADAEAAGFRPCKRCKPDGAPAGAQPAAKVAQACRMIESSEEEPSLAVLARAAGYSPHHFHRVFKSIVGVTPKAYARAHRIARLRANLPESRSVTSAIYESGYGSSGRFYETSSEVLGMSPATFRDGGAHAVIRYAVGRCSLGAILVAATDKGVCAIQLGDDPADLRQELTSRFPKARLVKGDHALERQVAQVIAFVDAPQGSLALPLDVRGTAFQHRVWQELRQIRMGETATYTEIAARIGSPQAVRAVASACASNPVAVAVPCHRVVRKGGALGGYRWGLARKRKLLDRERQS